MAFLNPNALGPAAQGALQGMTPLPPLPQPAPAPPGGQGMLGGLVGRIQSDPALQRALLTFASGAMQPVGAEQTPIGVLGQSLANSVDFLQRQRNASRQLATGEQRAETLQQDVEQRGRASEVASDLKQDAEIRKGKELDLDRQESGARQNLWKAQAKLAVARANKLAAGEAAAGGGLPGGMSLSDLKAKTQEIALQAQAFMTQAERLGNPIHWDEAWNRAASEQVRQGMDKAVAAKFAEYGTMGDMGPRAIQAYDKFRARATEGLPTRVRAPQPSSYVGKSFQAQGKSWTVEGDGPRNPTTGAATLVVRSSDGRTLGIPESEVRQLIEQGAAAGEQGASSAIAEPAPREPRVWSNVNFD